MEDNYFTLPFYKKWFINIKNYFKKKKENFKFPFVKLGIFLLVLIMVGAIVLIVVTGKKSFPVKAAYDKTNFVDYDNLTEEEKTNPIIIENERYIFTLDPSTTHFVLTDKLTGQNFASNPTPRSEIDTLTIWYEESRGEPFEYGNYQYSINYEDMHRYALRKTPNSIEVLYYLGGKVRIDYTDLPRLISQERFETLIQNRAEAYVAHLKEINDPNYSTYNRYLVYLRQYRLNTSYGYYALNNPNALTPMVIEGLYKLFYEVCGYTTDDLTADNLENGIEPSKTYPTFEVSMRYSLEEENLKVELINESIKDYEDYPLIYIDILPYFSAVNADGKGYALIPDGSGAIVDFNNNRQYATNYEQRLYGDDLATSKNTFNFDKTKIALSVYGMMIEDDNLTKGMINILESGSPNSSIVARINSEGNQNGYNQIFYRYYYRETDTYKFESLAGLDDIQTWTNDANDQSVTMLIESLADDVTYVGMAKQYQKYLIEQGVLTNKDDTKEVVFNLTLLGGYLEKRNFLGINYQKVQALTTSDNVETLALGLKQDGIKELNIIYQGFMNNGINTTYNGKIKFNKAITTKKKLQILQNHLAENTINFYPMFNIANIYTDKHISNKKLITNQYGKTIVNYQNNEALYQQDLQTTPLYTLKPTTYKKTLKSIDKVLNKLKIQNMAFSDIGNILYGSYQSTDMIFKNQTLTLFQEIMQNYQNYRMAFTAPNDYALKYATIAIDVPTEATDYTIFQTSVPFYQLVLSGYLDYSAESFNMNDEYSFAYHKMKAIETLSNIAMTWTYERTTDLVDTEYNYLYSTYYDNWYQASLDVYQELNALNIYSAYLINHQYLNAEATVVKTTYSNGVEIVLNYSPVDYLYNGILIAPNNYQVVKGGN